jgi:hypothetical protein
MVKASWLVGAATCRPHDRRESLHEYPTDAVDRAGISALRGLKSFQPARQLILALAERGEWMLPLNSPTWADLRDAYGASSDIPGLLRDLEALPPNEGAEAEPYFSLWSALCHQGDVYTASYAAVPHLVRVAASAPERVPWTVFQMVACIEIARSQ